jgi:glutathione S-transferase
VAAVGAAGGPAAPGSVADMAAAARTNALAMLAWFDAQLIGRQWLAQDRFTLADIALLTSVDFAGWIGLPLADEWTALRGWQERAAARLA